MKKLNSLLLFLAVIQLFSCSEEVPKKVLNPLVQKMSDQTESFDPQMDILFVVDDSGSMSSHQDNLARNMGVFAQAFAKRNLSYHLGVISTDIGKNGELLGQPKFVDNKTKNGLRKFSANILLGTNGSATEQVFDPLYEAFQPHNLKGANKGFLREGGFLVVIFITDAEDQSYKQTAQSTFDFLASLKKGRKYVMTYGVVVPTGYTLNCSRDSGEPKKIEEFLALGSNAPNNIMGLCDLDYGQRLARFSQDIADLVSTVFLERLPNARSIRVSYGDLEVPQDAVKGWSYDAGRNAVVFGPEFDFANQPPETKIHVTYDQLNL